MSSFAIITGRSKIINCAKWQAQNQSKLLLGSSNSVAVVSSSFSSKKQFSSSSSSSSIRFYSSSSPVGYRMAGSSGGSGGSANTMAEISRWPISKTNTILNIVPQGQRFVVERFGRMNAIHDSGFFIAIPFVDQISYVVDIRERAIDIVPQAAITRDNVSVQVSGNLFVRFVDPERAAYGARNPLYSAMQHAQSAMRSAIGEMELDEILRGRAQLNTMIKGSLQEAAVAWGLEVRRYEITEITPDEQIRLAMDKQAAAERDRREQVLRAEGDKRRAELTSEGVKISLTNESEGMLIKVKNEAEAEKIKLEREAEGEAIAVTVRANAQAQAIAMIAAELQKPGGEEAAKLALARDYVQMYGQMGSKSNTMMFSDRPADMKSLLAQAAMAIKSIPSQLESPNEEDKDTNSQ